ncbi:hypothetical protein ABT173_04155 [Streptomyces sp. NPDC001795]|uniref:hypothetical protein n=1 Tax=unclassified Streptomyces TaxID=2593676 RepID=UPI00332E06B4
MITYGIGGRDMAMADSDRQVTPASRHPRAAALASALLLGLGALCVYGYGVAEHHHWAAETARCGTVLPISRVMWATAYAGPLFTLAAVVLSARALRRSTGRVWPAALVFTLSLLLFLYQVLGVWFMYHPAVPDVGISCA